MDSVRLSPSQEIRDKLCLIISGPCRVTMLAIWMTGSIVASGKIPFRPAHSISKLKMRKGAIFDQLPSGACEIKALYLGAGCHFSSDGESQRCLPDVDFQLACGSFALRWNNFVFSCRDFNPIHASDLKE